LSPRAPKQRDPKPDTSSTDRARSSLQPPQTHAAAPQPSATITAKDKLLATHVECIAEITRIRTELKEMEKQVSEYGQIRHRSTPKAVSPSTPAASAESKQQKTDLVKRFYWPLEADSAVLADDERCFVREAKFLKKSFAAERNVREDVLFLFSDIIVIARPSLHFVDSTKPGQERLLLMHAVIPIHRCCVFDLQDTEAKRNNSFQVIRSDGRGRKCVTLAAASVEEKAVWIDLIQNAILRFPYSRFYFDEILMTEMFV